MGMTRWIFQLKPKTRHPRYSIGLRLIRCAARALKASPKSHSASFRNENQGGGFKANPGKSMQRYFDLHVYVVDWMTPMFTLRLPFRAFAKAGRNKIVFSRIF